MAPVIDHRAMGRTIELPPPRPMRPEDEPVVRELYATVHPTWPERAAGWYTAYPTLTIWVGGRLVGFTSCSISPGQGTLVLYGNDLCILPQWQKQGFGWQLAEARSALGRAVGATFFIGITQPSNASMIRIFERQGFHPCQPMPGYFHGEDGMVWAGSL